MVALFFPSMWRVGWRCGETVGVKGRHMCIRIWHPGPTAVIWITVVIWIIWVSWSWNEGEEVLVWSAMTVLMCVNVSTWKETIHNKLRFWPEWKWESSLLLLVFSLFLLHEIFASQLTEQRISIFPFSPGDNEKEIVFHLSDFQGGIEVNLVASLISRKSSP